MKSKKNQVPVLQTKRLSTILQCGENEEESPNPKILQNNPQVGKTQIEKTQIEKKRLLMSLLLIRNMTDDDFDEVDKEKMTELMEKSKRILQERKKESKQEQVQKIESTRKIDMALQMTRVMKANKIKMKSEINRILKSMEQEREKQDQRQKEYDERIEAHKIKYDDMNNKIRQKAESVASLMKILAKKQQDKKAQLQILERKRREAQHLQTSITKNSIDYQTKKEEIIEFQIQKKQKAKNLQSSFYLKRQLNNQYQSLKGNIRVYCRIRPSQESNNIEPPFYSIDKGEIKFVIPKQMLKSNNLKNQFIYSFEQVFENCSQRKIFEEFEPLIDGVLDGKNVCIFAYGQTGSGKTYTMQGYEEEIGIIPRSIQRLYNQIQSLQKFDWSYSINIECVEIYNNEIRDLFGKKKQGLTSIKVTTAQQINQLLETANKNRKVAGTNCNQRSSRSHLIFMIKLSGKNEKKGKTPIQSCLCLVDLAGSERITDSKVQGQRFKQASQINKSLSALRLVIEKMVQKAPHIPFRNCKLTTILYPYLSGQSRTVMMMCISPERSDWSQTQTSLSFSENVKKEAITKN